MSETTPKKGFAMGWLVTLLNVTKLFGVTAHSILFLFEAGILSPWVALSILCQKTFAYAPHFTLCCVYVENLCRELNPRVHCRNSCKASVCWFTNCFWWIFQNRCIFQNHCSELHTMHSATQLNFQTRELISALWCTRSLFVETITVNITHCAMTENWNATIYIISEHEKAVFMTLLDVIHLCRVIISVFESWFSHASYMSGAWARKEMALTWNPSKNLDWKHYVVPGVALAARTKLAYKLYFPCK